jgi:hypothetical protein
VIRLTNVQRIYVNKCTRTNACLPQQRRVPVLPLAFFSSFLLRIPLDPSKLALNKRRQPSLSPSGSRSPRSQGNTSIGATTLSSFRDRASAYNENIKFALGDQKLRIESPRGGTDTYIGADRISRGPSHAQRLEGLLTGDLVGLQSLAQRTYLSHETRLHLRDMISALRMHPLIAHGPSLDAWVQLERATTGVAVLTGRTFVTATDVMEIVVETLSHLIILTEYGADNGRMESLSKDAEPPVCFVKPGADWHPLTAARFVVHQVYEFYLPVLR